MTIQKTGTTMPKVASARPERMARFSAAPPVRWIRTTTARTNCATTMTITPKVRSGTRARVIGSVWSALKWLKVPRAAWAVMAPTSTVAATAKTVPSHRPSRLPLVSLVSSHASVAA